MVTMSVLCMGILVFSLLSIARGDSCGNPPNVRHGLVRLETNGSTTTAHYSCDKGFDIVGPTKLRCLSTGQWKKSKIRCVSSAPVCQAPSVPLNAQISRPLAPKSNYAKGQFVFFRCKPGYKLAGGLIFQKCLGRKWTRLRFNCIASKDCGSPDVLRNGETFGSDYIVGKQVQYVCDPGFVLDGDDLIECLSNKTWSGSVPVCKAVDCGSLPDPKHGVKTTETRTTFGGRSEFKCRNKRFVLVGSKQRFCQADGDWSGEPTFCRAPCRNPGAPSDGRRKGDSFSHGDTVSFRCKKALRMKGPRQITCNDGTWSKKLPRCLHPSLITDYSECGVRKTGRSRMVGGKISGRGMWPWQVGLYRLERGKEKFLCGGALISRQWILTGAHCFMYKYTETNERSPLVSPPSIYKILVGDNHHDTNESSERSFYATEIIMHPHYNDDFYEIDIPLVKLSSRARLGGYVRTICLPKHGSADQSLTSAGRRGFVAGWGATQVLNPGETADPQSAVSPKLEFAKFEIQDIELCSNSTDYYFNGSAQFCAGTDKAAVGVCTGDSGGPFAMETLQGKNKRWFAVGLVSWGEGCAIRGRYTFYTKVAPYVDWIQQHTSKKT